MMIVDRPAGQRKDNEMVNMVERRVGKVAYSDTGEGPVVVLLHATLHDRHDFNAILPGLQRDHRVIAVDWQGHGDSPARKPTSSADRGLVRRRPCRRSNRIELHHHVRGNSVRLAAARLAITGSPNEFRRLVLVNAGGFITSPASNLYCRVLGTPAVMKPVVPRFIPQGYMKATSDTDHAIRRRGVARAEHPRRRGSRRSAAGQVSPAPSCRSTPDADSITAPCLVIWGWKRYRDPDAIRPRHRGRNPDRPGGAADRPRGVLIRPRRIPGIAMRLILAAATGRLQ